jgi:hypothetical protein
MSEEQAVSVPPEVRETIETRVAWARAVVIGTAAEREAAVAAVREVKALSKEINTRFDESVKRAHSAWKSAVALRDSFLEGPATVERLVKAAITRFDDEQERIRLAEQRRLQAIEDERRRKEQAALEAAARVQREKEEAARRLEEDARKRAQEAANEADLARALAEAEKARKAALAAAAKAEEKASAAMDVPPPVAVSVAGPAKQAGESTAVIHKARVVDAIAFIKAAVANGRFEFVDVNEKALGQFATRTKGAVPLTGVEFYQEKQLRVGGR